MQRSRINSVLLRCCLSAGDRCRPVLVAEDGGGVPALRREGRQREPCAQVHGPGATPQGPDGAAQDRTVRRETADAR